MRENILFEVIRRLYLANCFIKFHILGFVRKLFLIFQDRSFYLVGVLQTPMPISFQKKMRNIFIIFQKSQEKEIIKTVKYAMELLYKRYFYYKMNLIQIKTLLIFSLVRDTKLTYSEKGTTVMETSRSMSAILFYIMIHSNVNLVRMEQLVLIQGIVTDLSIDFGF
eukprot:TRINITY_DN3763_c0_g1_i1.p1 TRINITY_DN3763_c0_g1~~TRINITY_DN3763_c0_g1_i1.p1  ORF type:complete len:166 (-),score=3.36 TRINITY_DN3763_c0_g1_i1:408-905(-)